MIPRTRSTAADRTGCRIPRSRCFGWRHPLIRSAPRLSEHFSVAERAHRLPGLQKVFKLISCNRALVYFSQRKLEELCEGPEGQRPGQDQPGVRPFWPGQPRHAHEGGRSRTTETLRAPHAARPRSQGSRASAANWSVGRSSRVVSQLQDQVLARGPSCCYHAQQDSCLPSTRGEPPLRGPLSPATFRSEAQNLAESGAHPNQARSDVNGSGANGVSLFGGQPAVAAAVVRRASH